MKKLFQICAMCFLVFSLSGFVISEELAKQSDTSNNLTQSEDVDFDLTKLSSTMIYAQVFDLLGHPDKYLGKTFKFVGEYDSIYVESLEKEIRFLIIHDATSCCPQGLEIELAEGIPTPAQEELVVVEATYLQENTDFQRHYMNIYKLKKVE